MATSASEVPTIPPLDPALFAETGPYDPDVKVHPETYFPRWGANPPFYTMMHGRPNAVIGRHASVRDAFNDYATFSVVPQHGWGADYLDYFNGLPVITELDPPDHSRMRRLMRPAFAPRRVDQMQEGTAELVDSMVREVAALGAFDLMSDFAQPLAQRLVLGTFLGFPVDDWQIFTNLAQEVFSIVEPNAPRTPAYLSAFEAGRGFCSELIEQRRRQPEDDLVGSIVAAHDEAGAISTEELFGILMVLFSAGLGTMAGTVGLCVARLCRHPDQMAIAREDVEVLPSAVEECLRVEPVGTFRHRYVMEDVVVDGVPLYGGMIVHLSMAASNFDPDVYRDPERFDVRRNPRNITTFGYGAHLCIGQALARVATRTVVGALLDSFPTLRLADSNAPIVYGGSPQERTPQSIQVRID